jgi:hypothetical protein
VQLILGGQFMADDMIKVSEDAGELWSSRSSLKTADKLRTLVRCFIMQDLIT